MIEDELVDFVLFLSRMLTVSVKFEPRDLWVGVYWDKDKDYLTIYICFIPTIPIKFEFILQDE